MLLRIKCGCSWLGLNANGDNAGATASPIRLSPWKDPPPHGPAHRFYAVQQDSCNDLGEARSCQGLVMRAVGGNNVVVIVSLGGAVLQRLGEEQTRAWVWA